MQQASEISYQTRLRRFQLVKAAQSLIPITAEAV